MLRTAFAVLLLALVASGGAHDAQAQTTPDATVLAVRFVKTLDAGDWQKAHAMIKPVPGRTAESLQKFWTADAQQRGDTPDWRGLAAKEWERGDTSQIFVPVVSSGGRSGYRITVERGLIDGFQRGLSYALFGPYAYYPGLGYIYPDGSVVRYYRTANGTGLVLEFRNPEGKIRIMEIVKSTTPGTLVKLRNAECPADICGEVGTVQGGVLTWRQPKAIGGHSGGYLNYKTWFEGNEVVSHTTDPSPMSDLFVRHPELLPKPTRATLVKTPPMTQAQKDEAKLLIAQMEPLVESKVAQALSSQLSAAQAMANAQAARERSSERVRSFNRAMEGIGGALRDASANVGTYDESQANLNATVANIQNAAAVERQQQALAQQQAQARAAEENRQKLAANARWVAEKKQAASPPAPALSQSTARQSPNSAGSSPAQSKTSGAAMTFLMQVSVDAIINRMNGTCYSNLVTIPGPPGWPVLDHTNDRKAAALVDAYKAGFLAQCGQAGPVRSGNFSYIWNARGSESRPAEEYARQQRNKMFQVQVSP